MMHITPEAIITTASRQQKELEPLANQLSSQWQLPFIPRGRHSVTYFYTEYGVSNVFVIDHLNNVTWHKKGEESIKYHPGMSIIRIKRLKSGNNDSMIDLLNLQPTDVILDCTLGLASDAIVAQYVAYDGQVVGLEADRLLAQFTQHGLKHYPEQDEITKQAMLKIKVIHGNYTDFLKSAEDKSFDYVYFDPMFRRSINASETMQVLKTRCCNDPLNLESVEQAIRVARKKVILKETNYSKEFTRVGFKQIFRPNSSFSYGIIDVEGKSWK